MLITFFRVGQLRPMILIIKSISYMFQLPHQLILILAILTLTITLKPSEVGVNDWAINSLGELRDLTFSKNKIYFVSHLSSIGILDKYSGSVEARALMAES
jgi:hypothetical protein